ncbi:hypothetical protein [Pseudomonas putida]|uniref:hypothetical protein n=1 Tax=Pseudomonas putida TaxID=303 RepID=UPI00066CBA54|nr:hypothetical protein [Pseudomonas putida]
MTGNQSFTTVLSELPSAPPECKQAELDRLRELEKVAMQLTHGLGFGRWDVPNKGGVAGDLVAAVTDLHLDAELEAEVRQAYEKKLVELGVDVKAISEAVVVEPGPIL